MNNESDQPQQPFEKSTTSPDLEVYFYPFSDELKNEVAVFLDNEAQQQINDFEKSGPSTADKYTLKTSEFNRGSYGLNLMLLQDRLNFIPEEIGADPERSFVVIARVEGKMAGFCIMFKT